MDTRITQFLGHVDTFTRRIANLETDRWENPSPCEGWSAKDVLDHVIDTQRDVFSKRGLELGPRPEGAPHEAWAAHAAAVRSAVTDEETLLATYDSFFGPTTGTSRAAHGLGLRGTRVAGGIRPPGRPRDKNAASPFQRSRGLALSGDGCALSHRSSFRRPSGLGHIRIRLNARAPRPLEGRRHSHPIPEHGKELKEMF